MRKTIIILLSMMMFTSMMIVPGDTGDVEAGVPDTVSALTPHAPVRINNNTDFATLGLNGSGTSADPWIIENWEINGTGFGYCLYIGNTTEYFVVRNCSLLNASDVNTFPYFMQSGLIIYNATFGTITNTTTSINLYYGIYLYKSSDLYVDNCTGDYNRLEGIHLEHTNNSYITNNIFTNSSTNGIGIALVNTKNNVVSNNELNDISNCGIFQSFSTNNTMINNTCSDNGDWGINSVWSNHTEIKGNKCLNNVAGIFIKSSHNFTIIDNNCSDNSWRGLWLDDTNYSSVIDNTMYSNTVEGINIDNSHNNSIYYNLILDNTNQAFDNTGTNYWDNGYPSGGNYWSDYTGTDTHYGPDQNILGTDGIGDTNYTGISGGSGAVDNYPLMNPYNGTMPQIDDITTPNSTVMINSYWTNTPIQINVTHDDGDDSYITNITLFYIFSLDNGSFGSWTEFGTDFQSPWNFTFDFPDGEGYYEFYSIATDAFNNTESMPLSDYGACAYDITAPSSEVSQPDFWQDNRTIFLEWEADDSASGFGPMSVGQYPAAENVDLWMRESFNNQSWSSWELVEEDIVNSTIHNVTVLDDGWYRFYTIAQDLAGNLEAPPAQYDVTIAVDTILPVAVSGDEDNYTISQFSTMIFDASNSTDNMGISNYTWNFIYEAQGVEFHGETFNFTFNHYGQYLVTLTVMDNAGNSHQDTILVHVEDDEAPVADAGADQQSEMSIWITLDASDSTDNVGIIDYTWTFVYNGSMVTLDGIYPKYKFMEHGTYNVTLTVTDEAGNTATDTVEIFIEEGISTSGSGYNWVIVIFVLILILSVIIIMAFYFRKTSSVNSEQREYGEDDGYDDDDHYERDR